MNPLLQRQSVGRVDVLLVEGVGHNQLQETCWGHVQVEAVRVVGSLQAYQGLKEGRELIDSQPEGDRVVAAHVHIRGQEHIASADAQRSIRHAEMILAERHTADWRTESTVHRVHIVLVECPVVGETRLESGECRLWRRIRCRYVDTVVGRDGGHFSLAQHAVVEEHVVDVGVEQVGGRAEERARSDHVANRRIGERNGVGQLAVEVEGEHAAAKSDSDVDPLVEKGVLLNRRRQVVHCGGRLSNFEHEISGGCDKEAEVVDEKVVLNEVERLPLVACRDDLGPYGDRVVAGEVDSAGHLNETVVEVNGRVGSTEAIRRQVHVEGIEKRNGSH